MLVLSRRVGEDIHINDDIVITVMSIQGDKVRLGITAPREQTVHRGEVYAEIQRLKAVSDQPSAVSQNGGTHGQ